MPDVPKLKLTPEQAEKLKRNGRLKGKPLRNSVAIESRYIAELMKLTNQMIAQTNREMIKAMKAAGYGQDAKEPTIAQETPKVKRRVDHLMETFNSLFKRKANELATNMLGAVTNETAVQAASSLKELSGGLTFKMNFTNPQVKSAITAAHKENVGLISSIPDEYMANVNKILMRSASRAGDMTGVTEALENAAGITKRKAKNIALDQTRKAHATINRVRLQAVGVKKYEWVHSGGGAKARHKHITSHKAGGLNGGIFEYDDPPNAAEDGEEPYYANPSEMINCKCIAAPVIDFDDNEYADEDEE